MRLINARLAGRAGTWDILLDDGLIVEVRPHRPEGTDMAGAIDLEGRLVTRPYVDAHMHLDKAYQSDSAPNRSGTLSEAIALGRVYKEQINGPSVYQRVIRGAREALQNGTTRIRTHVDVDPVAGLVGVVSALEAKGALRGLVDVQVVAFPQEGITNQPGVRELLGESLRLGCSAIGGIPARDPLPEEHIRQVFDLAEAHGVPVDMHADESDNPADLTLPLIVRETRRRSMQGRVTAGHCCSLSAQPPEVRAEIIAAVQEAGVHVLTLPSTNLYLQGRGDEGNVRRGLAPVRELLQEGVNVAYGSDNIRDPFNPFGNANMLEGALILAHAAHMGGVEDLAEVFAMGTRRAAALWEGRSLDPSFRYEVEPGAPADLLVFGARSPQEVIVGQAPPVRVIVGGRQVVQRMEYVQLIESFPSQ